jgi:histone-lysine N-methyltransferase ASH1L
MFSSVKKLRTEDTPKETPSNKPKAIYNPEEHAHGLIPLPIHVGKYMAEKQVDFLLPYDIWWLHTHGQVS